MSKKTDEERLSALTKKVLATPPKPRDESKIPKSKAKAVKSPRERKAAKAVP